MVMFPEAEAGNGPVILQLRKWDLWQNQLNISEYREAFISPTRELLVLLSHQSEILLLPLTAGKLFSSTLAEREILDTSQSEDSGSRSDPVYDSPSISEPTSAFLHGSSLTAKKYYFAADVQSLAWGHCGDVYNQHKDVAFKELLVVSSDHGVTVHGFRYWDKKNDRIPSEPVGNGIMGGRWMEWDPSASIHGTEKDHHTEGSEGTENFCTSRNCSSKKWLKTFLTEIETVESEGNFVMRFPKKSSFPSSAEVVSFNIFFSSSTFLSFLAQVNPEMDEKENQSQGIKVELEKGSFNLDASSDEGVSIGPPLKCSRVFSSSSHRLVGFVLTVTKPLPIKTSEEGRNAGKVIVVVAVVYWWGIQWICSVRLWDSCPSLGHHGEWTDFKFSDKLLVCLHSSGLISLWDATSGKFVAELDVLHCSGLNLGTNSVVKQSELSAEADITPKIVDFSCNRRTFKRLMVAFNSSLLAVVDECGVVYVLCVDDYILEKHYSFNKIVPHFLHCGLGLLAGWDVAGSEISGQRILSDISNVQDLIGNESFPFAVHRDDLKLQKKKRLHLHGKGSRHESHLTCFSSSSTAKLSNISTSQISSAPIRRIFLPMHGCNREDPICFSPLGVTRLVNRCTKMDQRSTVIVHTSLHLHSAVLDDRGLSKSLQSRSSCLLRKELLGETIGCSFQGCLYLVTKDGLFIVLPFVSLSWEVPAVESIGNWQPSTITNGGHQIGKSVKLEESRECWQPWIVEVLGRALLYEGPAEADHICLENGWDLKITRMHRLHLALHFMKFEEIEQSLEMLVDVNLAEEGVLRLIFTAVYQISSKIGRDNEVAVSLRLLALAACFAIKMIRRYGLVEHKKDEVISPSIRGLGILYLESVIPKRTEIGNLRKLKEMAHFLEIIRNLQCRLSAKSRRPSQGVVDSREGLALADPTVSLENLHLPIVNVDAMPDALEAQSRADLSYLNTEKLDFLPEESSSVPTSQLDSGITHEIIAHMPHGGGIHRKKPLPLENPKDMIARWKVGNLDLKTIVKDALQSDRLPLAVLQLHLQRSKDLAAENEPHDSFSEVRDVGRAIAYDLFLKGETGLAVATLQRLGEDIELSLRQLLFGTVRRSLRIKIAEEMKMWGYLGPHESRILDRIALIERLYPSSTFWGTFLSRQKQLGKESSAFTLPEANVLQFTCSEEFNSFMIECGEIDGVVIGSWTNLDQSSSHPMVDEDNLPVGYWASAAVWSDSWDQKTIDRIILDQPFLMGVNVLWESQLEYHICHNDWEEVLKLLDMIPATLLSNGSLQISLDGLHSAASIGPYEKLLDHADYFCPVEELEAVCINVPNVKIFTLSVDKTCSGWLRTLVEQELAKRFIFMKDYWEGTEEIIALLARTGFFTNTSKTSLHSESTESSKVLDVFNFCEEFCSDTVQALHRLVIHHCSRYNLPNLLDLYLDHHELILDNDSVGSLLEAAGECQWAKWLLLSRIKGREYDASFSNARSVISRNIVHGSNLSVPEIDEIIQNVDDMAEGRGELAALATLMYAPAPVQQCIYSGSVNRHYSSSAQCTLENLRPSLQHYPTLWHSLVSACFGQDPSDSSFGFSAKSGFHKSALSDYLNWRETLFTSASGDTSLLQMLPYWFSKSLRRLVQIFIQGPLGWQSIGGTPHIEESFIHRDIHFSFAEIENIEGSAISWEVAIQKNIEELFASSFESTEFGVEHHLHRGRALAAFNHLVAARAQNLKLSDTRQDPSATSVPGQNNIQSDVQTLLAPFTQDEESLLSAVMPLAVMHFEESVLVASCAFLLELCGLSASMLRVDVAALCRISSFYKSIEYKDHYNNHIMSKGSAFHPLTQEGELTVSLARALADDYLQHDTLRAIGRKDTPSKVEATQRPSRALISVLQHLEKASLPSIPEGNTCGSWLLSGTGDGAEFRSLQKAASLHWSLVTTFCQMHHLPLSTKYLSVLAKDNDWVGFLKEAQFAGFPFDVIVQVATKEFSDPRLKIHILNVLRSLQSARKKTGSATNSTFIGRSNEISLSGENIVAPVELFGLLGECEKQKNPGEALLLRAKDLHWSLLAMIASCFPDVSPLACLTVWLEITAARETSSIKVNDISSQIANKVGAAVQATNSLPPNSRALAFHYNRRNPKRRHLVEPLSVDVLDGALFNVSTTYSAGSSSAAQENMAVEGKRRAQEQLKIINDPDEGLTSLTKMVAVLCEQHLFLPLLRAFEMFLPSCSLLPFIRFLQAFSQMRLTDATNHINHFSGIFKDERPHLLTNPTRDCPIGAAWIGSTAVKAADAVLSTCPSPYEKRCLLHLLSSADFGDGGSFAARFRRLYWKINIAEPSLRRDDGLYLGNETIDDDSSLLAALEKNGDWERARSWARQLEASGGPWMNVVHHVTETQAEEMVAEWKEFLWDVPEERAALWGHCQTLFIRHRFSALQAGLFFLRHAEDVEKDIPAKELHEMLLLSLQWLSGTIDQTNPVYPLHLIREIETRVWLLAVESEAQAKAEGDFTITANTSNVGGGTSTSIIEQTAGVIARMDAHINTMRSKVAERSDLRDNNGIHFRHPHGLEVNSHAMTGSSSTKMKRRAKSYLPSRRLVADTEKIEIDDTPSSPRFIRNNGELFRSQEENIKIESSVSAWEERVGPAELERAVLSLLEFGQVTAAKQLHHKLSPSQMPSEFVLVDTTLKLASILSPSRSVEASLSLLDAEAHSVIQSHGILNDDLLTDPFQVLETLAAKCTEGSGRGLCKRIIAVVKAANVLGLSFSEAFEKRPIELLQLLSLKAQDSFEEAKLLVQTHFMPPASIAQILAESFLKGLLAAHRGGYMDSQKEEGPAPLLWRFSDFLKWAELCPLEPEIGHALMRLVITGQEIPHACEVELLILSHHFYKSSACLDGVDVLVALAATRVESYVSEGDFPCLARLITGVSNFRALNFILGILIENGQLELLLHKYSAADTSTSTAEAVRGFRMAVLTSLKHFNPHDLDAFAMVYNHFDMKHETASLLESRATQSMQLWFYRYDKERNEELLDSMRYFIEAAEVHSTMDAGNKTRRACAQASLLSLQIRMPDFDWLNLSETNARRALVEQSRFQEALIVAEAYTLNQPSEWALVLWNQMLKPELTEQFVAEFVAVLPLQPSMLMELARFYRAEVAARGDQSHFSVWLSPGGMPAEWARHLGRSFRSLLKRTRDLRLRVQLATIATGFIDVIDACMKVLDRVPDMAGPLVLRKGHGGAYLPLM